MVHVLTAATLPELIGKDLGLSAAIDVTQDRIDKFAEVTGDRQWIHVDVERARSGPFGRTVAHGLLTLSLIGEMARELFRFDGFRMGVNYGYDKIRFPAPVPVDSKIRLGARVLSFETLPSAVQTVIELTVVADGAGKPACVAQMIFRHTP